MTSDNLRTWTFLTNHARVLILIAETPDIRLREIAARVGITERATQRIVVELEADGYLSRKKEGRRNRYSLHPEAHLRHPLEDEIEVGQLIDFISSRELTAEPPTPTAT